MRFKSINMAESSAAADDLFAALGGTAFQLVFNKSTDGLIVVDDKGTVRAANNTALQMNGMSAEQFGDMPFEAFMDASTLDWSAIEQDSNGRRKDFHATTKDGRAILTSMRHGHADNGGVAYTLITQRDLQVLDHLRRSASGISGGNVFKFVTDREIAPDYDTQRRLSSVVDDTVRRSTRALHQGARLLMLGESGSGKTELARYLHRVVGTREEPFVQVNCGAIPESLFESEMFGYEKGAFTGALQTGKKGLIESAEGGTLFLDEVGEIPLASQAKLLKFLEDGVIQPIGGRHARRITTRVISATNRDLWSLVEAGRFRRDLYYRLAVITVELPPLRVQPALTDHLIDHFVAITNRMRKPGLSVAEDCRAVLKHYAFPGNIRELHNLIQHLSVTAEDEARAEHLPEHVFEGGQRSGQPAEPPTARPEPANDADLRSQVRAFERDLIDRAIDRYGSKRKAAAALGVDIGTIVRKTKDAP